MAGSKGQALGPSTPRKPTLKTIAELCGLGVPTVSRALSDSHEIGEETKRRIRRIAEDIGYVPDRAGQRLRTGKTQVISLVFVLNRDEQLGRLIPSIATALLATGFQISIVPALTHEHGLISIKHMVENRMSDAVIFNETLVDDPRVTYLVDRGFPFATHGRNALSHLHAHFDFDNAAYARSAMQLLQRRGRQRLALFGPPQASHYGRDTFLGATEAATELGLPLLHIGACSSDPLSEIKVAANRFVARHGDCDGYLCASGAAALAMVSALQQAGHVVGSDVDVVAKGSRTFMNMLNPAIAAIEEDVGRAAEFLAQAVLQAIRAPEAPPMQQVEQPDFSAFM